MITDGLLSFIQSTIGRVKVKMGEDHEVPDLEVCDGCHLVLNCREAVEIPGFPVCCPVTISIGLLFTGLPVKRVGCSTPPWSNLQLNLPPMHDYSSEGPAKGVGDL